MTRFFLIGFTLLILSSGPAYAEWVSIGSTDSAGGYTVYVDSDTIRRKGNLVRMWSLNDFKTVQQLTTGSILSFKMQGEYDCADMRGRMLTVTTYSDNMGAGKVVYANSDGTQWESIILGSAEQDVWEFACNKK
jgi:hypothetical protein